MGKDSTTRQDVLVLRAPAEPLGPTANSSLTRASVSPSAKWGWELPGFAKLFESLGWQVRHKRKVWFPKSELSHQGP